MHSPEKPVGGALVSGLPSVLAGDYSFINICSPGISFNSGSFRSVNLSACFCSEILEFASGPSRAACAFVGLSVSFVHFAQQRCHHVLVFFKGGLTPPSPPQTAGCPVKLCRLRHEVGLCWILPSPALCAQSECSPFPWSTHASPSSESCCPRPHGSCQQAPHYSPHLYFCPLPICSSNCCQNDCLKMPI